MISEVVLQTLEFDKVRDQLARHAAFSASRELVAQLHPSTDGQWILQAQIRTSAARALIESFADVSIGGARDVRPAVEHARRGGILEASRVQEIAATLGAMRRLRGQVLRNHPDFVPLHPLAEQLPNLATLEHEIERTIGPDGEVLDSASAELGRLRSAIRVAFNRCKSVCKQLSIRRNMPMCCKSQLSRCAMAAMSCQSKPHNDGPCAGLSTINHRRAQPCISSHWLRLS